MRRLLKYARKQWKLYLTSAVFLILGVYLSALGPKYIKEIIDTCVVGGRGDLFFTIAVPMLVVYLINIFRAQCTQIDAEYQKHC